MKPLLTRRHFSQLVLASTALAGLGYPATALAQTPLILYGASTGATRSSARALAAGVTIASGLVLQSLDLTTGSVQDLPIEPIPSVVIPPEQPPERITGFSSLTDGTLVLATTPVRTPKSVGPSRLAFPSKPSGILSVPGLESRDAIWSLQGISSGSLLAIVGPRHGARPNRLANINGKTGQITFLSDFPLPTDQWFGTLTQCPNGTIYATAGGSQGDIRLVQLELQQRRVISLAQLRIGNRPLQSGVKSLACSPEGQLLALFAPRYQSINSLYSVEPNTGAMSFIREFAVNAMTFGRT